MVKKRVFVFAMCLFLAIFTLLNFFSVYYLNTPLSPVALTGQVVENGVVKLYVEGGPKVITIHSPLNASSDYAIGTTTFILNLSVSADFFVDDWNYSLYDLKHSNETATELDLTPNATTISAKRWGNLLTVSAHETDGNWVTQQLVFYININNSEPVFGATDSEVFVCEGDRLDYRFNASDVDEEELVPSITPTDPIVPLYVDFLGMSGLNVSLFKIKSGPLIISLLEVENGFISKTYEENVSVKDASTTNTVSVNITAIEVNNPVALGEDLGAQTVYFNGSGTTFYHQMDATDAEDGTSDDGNLVFNLSGAGVYFSINSSTGVMNYTPLAEHNGSVLNLTACAIDNALISSHVNFSVCSGDGHSHSNESTFACDNFSLTITDVNRAPVIDLYSPSSDDFTVAGTETTVFSASVSDADGTIPDMDWYVDGVLKEENDGLSNDDYSYSFGCGVRGAHNVSMVTTDGLVNVSQVWNVSVSVVACAVGSSGGGGGGGGGGTLGGVCVEDWACGDWDVCQNVERSFSAKSLSPEDYSFTKEVCAQNQFDDRFCGLQLSTCLDLSICNNSEFSVPKPTGARVCYFTENPSCEDGITNCHDGACELLVDCGGPCETCPTCSDGKQNQGEGDVDCGGPCPYRCDVETPFSGISYALIGLAIILIAAVVFIGIKLFNIWRYGGFLKKKKKR